MLQKMHENIKGWIAWVVLGLLCLTFVLWGVQSYVGGGTADGVVAKVGDLTVTERQLNQLVHQLQRNVTAKGAVLGDAMTQQLKQMALQNLIAEAALSSAAAKSGFAVTPEQAHQVITQTPAFQQEGEFSPQKFQQFLYGAQLTRQQFLNRFRKELLISQAQVGIEQSDFVLPSELKQYYYLTHQQRNFSYLVVPAKQQDKSIKVTQSEIKRYFDNNQSEFRTPEKVSIDYVVATTTSDELGNLSFTNPDSLEPVAKALHLTIKHSSLFDRDGSKTGIAQYPEVVAAAFSEDVLAGNNSNPISLKEGNVVVLRLKQREASHVPPLASVKTVVKAHLLQQKQQAAAALLANKLEEKLKSGAAPVKLARQQGLKWTVKNKVQRDDKKVPEEILSAVFDLSLNQGENITTVAMSNGDTAVLRLKKITHLPWDKANEEEKKTFSQKLQSLLAGVSYRLYVNGVKDNTPIKIFSS